MLERLILNDSEVFPKHFQPHPQTTTTHPQNELHFSCGSHPLASISHRESK